MVSLLEETLAYQSAVKKDAPAISATSDKSPVLGWIGCLFLAIGFYRKARNTPPNAVAWMKYSAFFDKQ